LVVVYLRVVDQQVELDSVVDFVEVDFVEVIVVDIIYVSHVDKNIET